jgi:hypothetical protein
VCGCISSEEPTRSWRSDQKKEEAVMESDQEDPIVPLSWPIDIWVPESGWVTYSTATEEMLQRSILFADVHGDLEHPPSRWRRGAVGARSVGVSALVEFPPGPGDRPFPPMFQVLCQAVDQGVNVPLHSLRRGAQYFAVRRTPGRVKMCRVTAATQ